MSATPANAWYYLRQIFYGLPWRYFYGRRHGFARWQSARLAWAFTSMLLSLSPMPPGWPRKPD